MLIKTYYTCGTERFQYRIMITRHHLGLTILWSLIITVPYLFTAPLMVFTFCSGACIGVMLPDVQMSRPKRISLQSVAWGTVQIPRRTCTPVLCRIYQYLGYPGLDPSDKRVTHSLPGLLALTACIGVIFLVPAALEGNNFLSYALLFVSGTFTGLLFHLIQDLCTRKGIYPFFPFSDAVIAGSIRPCDHFDHRILWFHVEGTVSFFIVLVLGGPARFSPGFVLPVSVTAFVACIGTMVCFSDVSIRSGPQESHATISVLVLNSRES